MGRVLIGEGSPEAAERRPAGKGREGVLVLAGVCARVQRPRGCEQQAQRGGRETAREEGKAGTPASLGFSLAGWLRG